MKHIKSLIEVLAKHKCKYDERDNKFIKSEFIFDLVDAMNIHGSIMNMRSKNDDAIREFLKCVRIYAAKGLIDNPTKESEGLGDVYNNMGVAYLHKRDFDQARKYYELSRDLYIKVRP